MASALVDIEPLFESINTSTLLLTPNRRLAAHLQTAYAEACQKRHIEVWAQPDIQPLDDWISRGWQQLKDHDLPLVERLTPLHSLQETLLWERIIRNDEKSLLLKPYATAKQAQAAWRTLQLWQCDIDQTFYFHPDTNRFADWARQFQAHCEQFRLTTPAGQAAIVLEGFRDNLLSKVDNALLVGFQHLPPLYDHLIKTAVQNPHRYKSTDNPAEQPGTNLSLACENATQELRLAAQWAHTRLEANPNQHIAIIAPDLAQQRSEIESALTAVFEPQYWLPSTPRYQLPFNISAGIPLSNTALITSALNLLELLRESFGYQPLYALLKSPFIQLQESGDFDSGSELELRLREGGWPEFSLTMLIDIIAESDTLSSRYSRFLEILQAVQEIREQHRFATAEPAHWASVIARLLNLFNWPVAARRLDSVEYQQLTSWQRLLNDFAQLSAAGESVCGKLSLGEALNLLNRQTAASNFQAQTPQTPIQVLGMLEGGGLSFDAVWLLGMNDHIWPPSANPNPFIPIRLQQTQDMPHASPERELAFSRELLDSYRQATPLLIASYSRQADDQPLRASSLINSFTPVCAAELELSTDTAPHPYYLQASFPQAQETFEDGRGPALQTQAEQVAGGSAILKDQADCPFRAFAKHRLGAHELPEPSYHLSAAQRGTLLHRALEKLWNRLADYDTLLACDDAELPTIIDTAVRNALRPIVQQRRDLFGDCYQRSEIERLSALLGQWLAIEKGRIPFKVIATEQAMLINLKGLPLRIRIDRIDRLDDNSQVLIDYKTGLCSSTKWQGERLEEPQLPLYAISMAGSDAGEPQALAFARISVDQLGFVGIAARDGIVPGVYSPEKTRGWNPDLDWPSLNSQWREALESLATAFLHGEAFVDPARNNTCQYCQLQPFCRIHQLEALSEVDG